MDKSPIRPFGSSGALALRIALIVAVGCFAGNLAHWTSQLFLGGCDFLCARTVWDVLGNTAVFGGALALVLAPTMTLVATPIVYFVGEGLSPSVGPTPAILLASLLGFLVVAFILFFILLAAIEGQISREHWRLAGRSFGPFAAALLGAGGLSTLVVFVFVRYLRRRR